jgi:predicted outer membrane protein
MDRRIFLAGLAAASALPARAETAPPAPTTPTPGAKPSTAAPAPAEVMGLGDAEKQHLLQTMQAGTFSLQTSKLAVNRVQQAKLREFAELEVAEQETVGDVLSAIKAAANDTSAAPQFDDEQKAVLQKLQQAQGAAFDSAYLQAQVDGHHKLLQIQENYLANGKNLDGTNVAKLARGMIKEHLRLLGDLQSNPSEMSL